MVTEAAGCPYQEQCVESADKCREDRAHIRRYTKEMATEVRKTEKKGVLEAKNKEFPRIRKLFITILHCKPGRYYFHLTGRKLKFRDLNDSVKFIGLIKVKGNTRTEVFGLSILCSFSCRTPHCALAEKFCNSHQAVLGRRAGS